MSDITVFGGGNAWAAMHRWLSRSRGDLGLDVTRNTRARHGNFAGSFSARRVRGFIREAFPRNNRSFRRKDPWAVPELLLDSYDVSNSEGYLRVGNLQSRPRGV
jgi:hypothetical protein